MRGFEPATPAFPLPGIVCVNRREFARLAAEHANMPPGVAGYYDPRSNILKLSPSVFQSSTIAAAGVAAHEAGHAIQNQAGYATPKIDSRGVIFQDEKILLVKELSDGCWTLPGVSERRHGMGFVVGSTFITWLLVVIIAFGARFGQSDDRHQQRHELQPRRGQKRRGESEAPEEYPAEERPEDHAEPEHRADQAERARPVFRLD